MPPPHTPHTPHTPHPAQHRGDSVIALARDLPRYGAIIAALFVGFGVYRDVQELKRETITIPMAAENALRLKIANPDLRVPDPRRPGQYITGP